MCRKVTLSHLHSSVAKEEFQSIYSLKLIWCTGVENQYSKWEKNYKYPLPNLKSFFPWGYLPTHIFLMLLSKWFCIPWLTIKWLERERHVDSKSITAELEKITMRCNVGVQVAIMSDCLLRSWSGSFPVELFRDGKPRSLRNTEDSLEQSKREWSDFS